MDWQVTRYHVAPVLGPVQGFPAAAIQFRYLYLVCGGISSQQPAFVEGKLAIKLHKSREFGPFDRENPGIPGFPWLIRWEYAQKA